MPSVLLPRLMTFLSAIQAVDVRPIVNRAVGARPGVGIDPYDRNRLGEFDSLSIALPHRFDDGSTIPTVVGVGIQQPNSQSVNILDTHASMREEAIVRREKLLRRRIVHVDRFAVWHVDTQYA